MEVKENVNKKEVDVRVYISKLRDKIYNYFKEDTTGHSIDHLERTLNFALYLQSKEGGDVVVIAISAFIHDIHRIMSGEEKRYVSPKESLPVVEKFLDGLDITPEQKKHILYAVEHHEEYAFGNGVKVTDIETKILQDADNLDAIGAIGIVRCLKFGFSNNVKVYDPNVPLYQNKFDESALDASSIHHINNKLLRLGENMNTETAKTIAKKKTKLMKDFIDMYIEEFSMNISQE